jgi:hypothetical protein
MVLQCIPRVKGRVKPCVSVRPSYIFRYSRQNQPDLADTEQIQTLFFMFFVTRGQPMFGHQAIDLFYQHKDPLLVDWSWWPMTKFC